MWGLQDTDKLGCFNSIALRMAKIAWSSGHSEYNRIKGSPKGRTKIGWLRQVIPQYRFICTVI